MIDYEKLYFLLFNDITDTIEALKKIQQKTEDIYIGEGPPLPKQNSLNNYDKKGK